MRKLSLEQLNRLSNSEYQEAKKLPVYLILDNIRSLHNVGSAFRTSDAFRLEKIFLCGITGTPPNRELHKTALGAEDTVEWVYAKETIDVVNQLKSKGVYIASIEQAENSTLLNTFEVPNKPVAYIFGNEVFGVDQDVINNSDTCIEIPQFGTKHSFNVSVTMGIVLWDYMSKMGIKNIV